MNINEKLAFRIMAVIVILFSIALGLIVGPGKGIAIFLLSWTMLGLFQASLKRNTPVWDYYSKITEKVPVVGVCSLIAILGPFTEELYLERERGIVELAELVDSFRR
jgi:uncharacterized membrane protein YfbV (UPF0208 family)